MKLMHLAGANTLEAAIASASANLSDSDRALVERLLRDPRHFDDPLSKRGDAHRSPLGACISIVSLIPLAAH